MLALAARLRPYLPHDVYRALYGLGRLGYVPNYRYPRTLNEKATWWLRHSRDPRLSQRADKLAVREFVEVSTPWVRLPELYAVSEDAENFPFESLPDISVFKANHASQRVRVLRRPFDVDAVRAVGAEWLARPFGDPSWEWHYLPITRRLFAEEYLGSEDGSPPLDYKILVLNGRARLVSVFLRGGRRLRRITFDREWRLVPLYLPKFRGGPPDVVEPELHPPRPQRLHELLLAAELLAEDFPFLRVDFYLIREEIYFGELTFLPSAGYAPFAPVSYDRELGDLLDVGSPRPWWLHGGRGIRG